MRGQSKYREATILRADGVVDQSDEDDPFLHHPVCGAAEREHFINAAVTPPRRGGERASLQPTSLHTEAVGQQPRRPWYLSSVRSAAERRKTLTPLTGLSLGAFVVHGLSAVATFCRRYAALAFVLSAAACSTTTPAGEVTEIRIPRGAGGVGFLPLLVMEKYRLIEKHADVTVKWIDLGGPSVMNEALLSGSADFITAGPPAFLILWDRTADSAKVMGVAALSSLPMYLNTGVDRLKMLDDITASDKIGVTAIKVSIPAIVMQMYARNKYGASEATRFDKYTTTMTHPDGVIALLSGSNAIQAHFTSPPFHQRERKDSRIRTIMTSDEVMGGSTTFTMLSTTSEFRAKNPKVYGAVLKALQESLDIIVKDKAAAADLLLASTGEGGFTREELVEVLNDPSVKFTTTPENVMKYAEFMNDTQTIKKRPSSWHDLFFPEIHSAPGS